MQRKRLSRALRVQKGTGRAVTGSDHPRAGKRDAPRARRKAARRSERRPQQGGTPRSRLQKVRDIFGAVGSAFQAIYYAIRLWFP
jgi:hypothetical protein